MRGPKVARGMQLASTGAPWRWTFQAHCANGGGFGGRGQKRQSEVAHCGLPIVDFLGPLDSYKSDVFDKEVLNFWRRYLLLLEVLVRLLVVAPDEARPRVLEHMAVRPGQMLLGRVDNFPQQA